MFLNLTRVCLLCKVTRKLIVFESDIERTEDRAETSQQ